MAVTEQSPLLASTVEQSSDMIQPTTKKWQDPVVLMAVLLIHGILLYVISTTLTQKPVVTPPTVVGVLVPPEPLPMTPQPEPPKPKPQPQPKVEPRPAPPLPKAPASERAVTAPPPPPVVDSEPAEETVPPVEAAPEPAPAKPAPEPAVIPPRSDAAHLNNPAPVYPAMSRRLRETGRVLMDVYILANGQVGEVKLKQSSGFKRLDDAAMQAVKSWKYVPAKRGDEAIPFWYVQPLSFNLTE